MKIYKISQNAPNVFLHTEYTGFHNQQKDAVIIAEDQEGNLLGMLTFAVFQDEPYVQYIEVPKIHQRKGIATKMIKELQSQFPNQTVHLGNSTEDGSQFINSLKFNHIPNKEYEQAKLELDQVNQQIDTLDQLVKQWRKLPEDQQKQTREKLLDQTENYNDLYDKAHELEEKLRELSEGTTLIQ